MWPWKKKPEPIAMPVPEPKPLRPGICECDHMRCCHVGGSGRCQVGYPPNSEDNKTSEWSHCACQVFILDDDDDDGDDEPSVPVDPDVAELEKMMKGGS
jgi:hypothetical protein